MTFAQFAVIVGVLSLFVAYRMNGKRQLWNLPPGPKKLPLIGNVLVMPNKIEWETFSKWGRDYNSDIIHLDALGTSIVVLNSYKAATELLETRSLIYSSRSGWGFLFGMLPYGDAWRAKRRLFTKHFNPAKPEINQLPEIIYVRRFLVQLLERPNDFMQRIRTLVGSTSLSMTYGINVLPDDDPYINLVEDAMVAAAPLLVAGSFLVDIIPILKYVPEWCPGANFQRKAAIMREHAATIRNATFAATQRAMTNGDHWSSLVTEELRDIQHSDTPSLDTDLLKDVAAMTYFAGADTTASVLGTFFLAMVCYPEVQKKAQLELDQILDERLPKHSDIDSLPYLTALVQELYRWQLTTPLGVPHLSTSDDIYNNYHIPKNSVVITNIWAMANDEEDFPEPQEFRPERYLKNGKLDGEVRNPMDVVFGFGRRVCPGKHLSHSLVALTAASVLSTFDLLKKTDEKGRAIEPKREYYLGAVCRPLDFPCVIKPRSRHAEELIRSLGQDQ